MGGIAGAMGNVGLAPVAEMLRVLRHRGPDGAGSYANEYMSLSACRLGVNDMRGGNQPIANETGDRVVLCDGEILNHRELRAELRHRGHQFRTTSDTEAVVHLYEEDGAACIAKLRGMFALAIAAGDTLLLARDHLGIKPLYYAFLREHNLFLFASEIKALLQCELLRPELDEERLGDLVVPRYPVGTGTFLKGVRCVRPGHILTVTVRAGQVECAERPYFQLALTPDNNMPFAHARERTTTLLVQSIGAHLEAEAEVGLALSGGLDSTVIAMIARQHCGKQLTTFTVSERREHQDMRTARAVATQLGTAHHEIVVSFDDYLQAIPDYMSALERPVLGLGIPFYLLCREMAKRVKVCLVGEGADVLFGGSGDYLDGTLKLQFLERGVMRAQALGLALRPEVADIVAALCGAREFDQYVNNLFAVNFADNLSSGLHYYDACSMAWGLELRDPFYDQELLSFVNTVPVEFKANRHLLVGKYLLRYIALELFGPAIIDAVLRRKIGLGQSCQGHTKKFTDLCEAELPERYIKEHPYGAYFTKKQDVLLFDLFELIFIKHRGHVPAGLTIADFIKEKAARLGTPQQARHVEGARF